MEGIVLKTDTESLNRAALSLSAHVNKMEQHFEELSRLVSISSVSWSGEAGELHRECYEKKKESIEKIIRRLKEHSRELLEISSGYAAVEAKAEGISDSLMVGIIK